ncbi:hypothetical protein CcaverHIS002_0602300 [Cutaneotrichosporon cavernicola]|uniref:Gaa1-domain-containing protein n=1 Tax=Cutaneotrichosporon cavernicola TaxID=279322 RepID=A0AA48QXV2_9TREE|nr:uncharacterized protein CcaverHIS019_0601790 [Cutaneotrichosporon cavernicola]BEI85943.1 hypothetical protein CcaverHIS002_0602300 [Cutaneotrichosporon cavernicola]BEI93720.1 hypothetical protein CcaverHIS019_0601790 [Cutaneotrichosporon cavernicola]
MAEPISSTAEQKRLSRKLNRQARAISFFWRHLFTIRVSLLVVGLVWIAALPSPALWKSTFIDEHALMPSGARPLWDWADVAAADTYLVGVQDLADRNASWAACADFFVKEFGLAGLEAGRTEDSVYARVTPPRSEGTEAILVSANWMSRDGVVNARGTSLLLALGAFFKAHGHYAFDIYLVVGDGYITGLNDFISNYDGRANIWTAFNIDYPYHSYKSIGLYYEGVNGRLPNQDIVNVAAHVSRWLGGTESAPHGIDPQAPHTYTTGVLTLVEHFKYAALGRPSAAHGVLAKHRIDAVTFYAHPSDGPHGYYSLGKIIEGAVRSANNLLERLHASFFFYLLPAPDRFLPVGHYLPAAVLLGASLTLGGFDCPAPLEGAFWLLPPFLFGAVGWLVGTPLLAALAPMLPRPKGDARRSLSALAHLGYGALIPTLAMVNFPQALLLAVLAITFLAPLPKAGKFVIAGLNPALLAAAGVDLRAEWEAWGNVAWPAVFAIWMPLAGISAMT